MRQLATVQKILAVAPIEGAGKYLDSTAAAAIAISLGLTPVPVFYTGRFGAEGEWTIQSLLELAKGNYPGTENPREGIVIRPYVETYSAALKGRMSFKVLNNEFLLKGGD